MVQVIAEITWDCPARCAFCTVPKGRATMPLSKFERALALFRDAARASELVISGGEPSVVRNLSDYVAAARGLGYAVTVVTNAFIPEKVVAARPDAVEVSVDYWGEGHDRSRGVQGLFESARRLVRMAKAAGIATFVRSTLLATNAFDILKLRDEFYYGMGVPVLVMPARASPYRARPEDLARLSREEGIYVADNCPAGKTSFALNPYFTILACIFYREQLGQLRKFTPGEVRAALARGRRLRRYPCEAPLLAPAAGG